MSSLSLMTPVTSTTPTLPPSASADDRCPSVP
jgi:hypothetical protein